MHSNLQPGLQRTWRPMATLLASLLLCLSGAQAQQAGSRATITPNYKDADLAQITEAVSAVTGKTIIIDPRVKVGARGIGS